MSLTRREFLKTSALGAAALGLPLSLMGSEEIPQTAGKSALYIAKSDSARAAALAAIKAFGGLGKVISKGDVVVIKPNIAWDRPLLQAANTNPEVVAAICEEAFNAGAKTVKVFDRTIADPRRTYVVSGIMEAAKKTGADVKFVDNRLFKNVEFKDGKLIKEWAIYSEALECDCLINVPVAKTHGTSKVTLAMKNSMGLLGGNRGVFHTDIGEKLADLATVVKPKLTVLDAFRILTRFGPKGLSPNDAQLQNEVIVSSDFVAVDAYGSELLKIPPEEVPSVVAGFERGFGEMRLDKIIMRRVVA